jgi:uncharacterized integral membrane protein
MGFYVKGIILIIFLLFFVTFAVKNSQSITLNYFKIQLIELPVYGMVYISIAIGIFLGLIIGFRNRFNLQRTVKSLKRENKLLKKKIEEKKEEIPLNSPPGEITEKDAQPNQ